MAYVSQELKAKIAPNVKKVLGKYKLKGSLSVDNHSTLVLTIKSGKIDFAKNYNDFAAEREHSGEPLRRMNNEHVDFNVYWMHTQFTGKAQKCLAELLEAMKGDTWFDKSDSMTDYFHTAYYISIQAGKWNKPYVVA